MGFNGAPDELRGALRALTASEFEQLAGHLPPRWSPDLQAQGIDIGATSFGVIFKARWQSLSRTLRAELAEALGAAAVRLAGHMAVGPRIQFVADVVATRSGQRLTGVPPVLAPGMVADQLRGTSAAAGEALAAAAAAVQAGLACPEELAAAVGEYNDALATAGQVLADHGVVPVPDGRAELLDRLRELAVNADRQPMRAAAAAISATESELPVVRAGRSRAAALLDAAPAGWDPEQLRLAEGLTAIIELRRLVATGAGPADLLAVSARASCSLPPDLQGLVVLAASGSLPAAQAPHAAVPAGAAVA